MIDQDSQGYFVCPDHPPAERGAGYACGDIVNWKGHCYRARPFASGHIPQVGGNEYWDPCDHPGNGSVAQSHLPDKKPDWSLLHLCIHDAWRSDVEYHAGADVFSSDRCWRARKNLHSQIPPSEPSMNWELINTCRRPPPFPPDIKPEPVIVRSRLEMLEF